MVSISEVEKPHQATWVAKATVSPDGTVQMATAPDGTDHQFDQVEIAWYSQDRIKITIKDGGPAMIRQAYLTGDNRPVIVDLVAE